MIKKKWYNSFYDRKVKSRKKPIVPIGLILPEVFENFKKYLPPKNSAVNVTDELIAILHGADVQLDI